MLMEQIIQRTLRVPVGPDLPAGDSGAVARQLDAALLSVGFTLSDDLLAAFARTEPGVALDAAIVVLDAVRALVGDHVRHNVYFRDFPANVPDSLEFWQNLFACTLVDAGAATWSDFELIEMDPPRLNLLALPGYGTYQHFYEEMAATRAAFLPQETDRLTTLRRGASLNEEVSTLYLTLAGATVPASEADTELLGILAAWCSDGPQPAEIPIRENRALINRVRLTNRQPLLTDTVTDVLRLACALSGGDVSLRTPTTFRSLPRADRTALLTALDTLVREHPAKLADVNAHRETWKRLGERLHPHERKELAGAGMVFGAARGNAAVPMQMSFPQRMERAFEEDDLVGVVRVLRKAPGLLVRNLDRLLRHEDAYAEDVARLLSGASLAKPLEQVSSRVLLSLYEHLLNRAVSTVAPDGSTASLELPTEPRIFVNQAGRAWVTSDTRAPIPGDLLTATLALLETELGRRLPVDLAVDPDMLGVALPLSNKTAPAGFRVLPRGSTATIVGDTLRLFMHWRQNNRTTDYDLSALLLDADFDQLGQVSYTSTHPWRLSAVHSGDLTHAALGASEFIDVDLTTTPAHYIVPQVNVYAGESFTEVAESFFGFMTRFNGQRGLPFEPATVRMRSDLRGAGQVALPLVFRRTDEGWEAVWTHLYLRGMAALNRVEANRMSTALLVRSILGRRYLSVGSLQTMLARQPRAEAAPLAHVCLERPADLPADATIYTPENLAELIPL
jgi:stress response protein SCP2